MRAKELSDSLKETFQRRDDLQRQMKEVRSELDVASAQRDRLQGELRSKSAKDEATDAAMLQKDEKIHKLNAELSNWQSRVPPLVDRYRTRDEEARELESELDDARADRDQYRADLDKARDQLQAALARASALETMAGSEQTRIEPVNAGTLPGGLDASNEPHDDTIENEITGLKDQIDGETAGAADWEERNEVADLPLDDGPWARVAASDSDVERSQDDTVEALDTLESAVDDALPPYIAPTGEDLAETAEEVVEAREAEESSDDSIDDLRQIKGIGPSIEKTLRELGFERFHQIAEMTEFDIDRVARQLKGFRSRIYREDWIGQARLLQNQKNNSPS
jgi:predicted flap endonuclease-1-like 5' DNA nuclease